MRLFLLGGILVAGHVAIGPMPALAGGASPMPAVADAFPPVPAPPATVGQISLISGKAEFRGPGDLQWSPASRNDPVATGVALRTDPQSRAELRVGVDTIDLDGGTEITVVKLDRSTSQIALKSGRIDLDIHEMAVGDNLQIDVPNGRVWLLRSGRYDIDTGGGGRPMQIATFLGGARYAGGGTEIAIEGGDRVVLSTDGKAVATEPASGDEFAEWCGARAIDDAQLAAPYFMSRDMTGYAALDAAGSWRATANYGEVWVPKAAPTEWAPYRNGHWRWLAPWGWSWVDDRNWGFAVSHYGRWLFANGQWAWAPGTLTRDPIWSPAVVGFLGTPSVGLSYADGPGPAIAWFPLAPGEIYWPSYTADIDYIRAINAGNVADLSAIYNQDDGEAPAKIVNAHFANREFASVVPRPVFVAGGPVATALVTIPGERLLNAPAIMGSPRIGPPPPPAPTRVATTAAVHTSPPVTEKAVKGWTWANAVRAAVMHSRNFRQAARLRFAHLRLLVYGGEQRLRRAIVFRVARSDHAARPDTRKRVIHQ